MLFGAYVNENELYRLLTSQARIFVFVFISKNELKKYKELIKEGEKLSNWISVYKTSYNWIQRK